MEVYRHLARVAVLSLIMLAMLSVPISGQITTACTTSMISSFTPCLNFITGSTNGGSSPTSDCCGALGSLLSSGTDCVCLILTGNIPLQLPINRTLAISLPRACDMNPVPLKCKAAATDLPAPGPFSFGPALPPQVSVPEVTSPSESPLPEPPVASPSASGPTNQGQRPVVTPSSAVKLSHVYSWYLMVFTLGIMVMKY